MKNPSRPPDCVLLFSGGIDSTTLLWDLRNQGRHPHLLSFDYGQRHRVELKAARTIARITSCPNDTVALPTWLFQGSSQTSDEISVPHGHYAAESMKLTVVPNRNMVMLSLAGALALSLKCKDIFYAAHSGDHAIYPDCRPEFVEILRRAFLMASWSELMLNAPYIMWPKKMIVQQGASLDVPYELTYSCYEGAELHCGKCGTCTERREAFELAGIPDPTKYTA